MKKMVKLPTTVVIAFLCVVSTAGADSPATRGTVTTSLASMPLAFTENQGQWPDSILFRANAGNATMWFTESGAYYQFARQVSADGRNNTEDVSLSGDEGRQKQPDSIETMMIKANLVGSNPQATVRGEGLMEYKCNYLLGNDPARWRTDVSNHSAIVYEDIYPGIDLKYYGNGRQMEYDFIVSPGADPAQIMVRYDGARSLSANEAGDLVVETEWGEVVEQRPVVYQVSDGDRVCLVGEYVLKGDRSFGFELPDGYDENLPLVIDPTLTYSTYLGGSSEDYGEDIAVDASGAAYVTGYTNSTDFPTENPYQTDQGDGDAFVTKLSASGSSLIYSTYLGGSDYDGSYGITVDASGAAYVTGETKSTDFPTENPYQTEQGDYDVFVAKLSTTGSSLTYSTYLGGSGGDHAWGIAVDASGAAYVTGTTSSTDFPTENPYQTDQGSDDVFVAKLSVSGSSLTYSTYLGGSSTDRGCGIAVDASGAAHVTGYTSSTDFPTENPYQTDQGGQDVFVTKLSAAGNSLTYSTYLGGSGNEWADGIAVDASGAAYVMGSTGSTDFPTENPYQTDQGGYDVFVARLSTTGSSLTYSTYLGGSDSDFGGGIAVDAYGAAYVTGYTSSTDFPTENPYQTDQAYEDGFVAKLSAAGSSLIYSTYLGGSSSDYGWAIAVDASGAAYVTGDTYSTDFLTENPYQTDQGVVDAYVIKIADDGTSVDEINSPALPDDFKLSRNYPNPFNPQTQFEFSLPQASHVTVEIFNVLGQRVATLVDRKLPAGSFRVTWDGTDYSKSEVSSGVYLYRLTADEFVQSRKMMLLK